MPPAEVAETLVKLLGKLGRKAEAVAVSAESDGWSRAIEKGLEGASQPLILIAASPGPWSEGHLRPLVQSIDTCDHALGRRPLPPGARLARWLAARRWQWLFAVPAVDVHTPCRLHRREKLAAIPLQSASTFVDVEILAKATFFGHLIDEVPIPELAGGRVGGGWRDFLDVFRHPVLKSGPAEDAQGDQEGAKGPGRQDRQSLPDVQQAGAFQDDPAQGADQLGQR